MGMTSRRPTPLQVPDLQEWLREEQAQPVLYAKSWEEAKSDPWLVFHTSGTTGNDALDKRVSVADNSRPSKTDHIHASDDGFSRRCRVDA